MCVVHIYYIKGFDYLKTRFKAIHLSLKTYKQHSSPSILFNSSKMSSNSVFFVMLGVVSASLMVSMMEGKKLGHPCRASSRAKGVNVLANILEDIRHGNIIDSKNLTFSYNTTAEKYGKKYADYMDKKIREKNITKTVANKSRGGDLLPMASFDDLSYWLCILREVGFNVYPTDYINELIGYMNGGDWGSAANLIIFLAQIYGEDINPEFLAFDLAYAAFWSC